MQNALEKELARPQSERDNVAIGRLMAWLIRSERGAPAYLAEATINSAGGGPVLASLEEAARLSPDDLDIRRSYADALRTSGLLEKAREEYESCANLAPFDPSLRIAIGALWELLHYEKLALLEYEKALNLDPYSEVARLKVRELRSRAIR